MNKHSPNTGDKCPKRVLCYFCKKPIKADYLGGVFSKDGKEEWYHAFTPCLIKLQELINKEWGFDMEKTVKAAAEKSTAEQVRVLTEGGKKSMCTCVGSMAVYMKGKKTYCGDCNKEKPKLHDSVQNKTYNQGCEDTRVIYAIERALELKSMEERLTIDLAYGLSLKVLRNRIKQLISELKLVSINDTKLTTNNKHHKQGYEDCKRAMLNDLQQIVESNHDRDAGTYDYDGIAADLIDYLNK